MEITRIVKAPHKVYEGTRADPFWVKSSELHSVSLFHILLEVCSSMKNKGYAKYFNMLSMCHFSNQNATFILENIVNLYLSNTLNASVTNLRGIFSSVENTLRSIVVSTLSMLNPFLLQESLTRMLSTSTFDTDKLYEKKTAVFLSFLMNPPHMTNLPV